MKKKNENFSGQFKLIQDFPLISLFFWFQSTGKQIYNKFLNSGVSTTHCSPIIVPSPGPGKLLQNPRAQFPRSMPKIIWPIKFMYSWSLGTLWRRRWRLQVSKPFSSSCSCFWGKLFALFSNGVCVCVCLGTIIIAVNFAVILLGALGTRIQNLPRKRVGGGSRALAAKVVVLPIGHSHYCNKLSLATL